VLINIDDAVLVIVDIQEKLFNVVLEKDRLLKNVLKLVKTCKMLDVPIIITEQYPKGMGKTVPELVNELGDQYRPIEKTSFSCFGCREFEEKLRSIGRRTLLLTGIELHICVYQTAIDALSRGYRPVVIYDATSSRLKLDYEICLHRLLRNGVDVSTTDMTIFELVRDASHPKFRDILKIVKE